MVGLKQELVHKLTQKVTPQLITYQQLLLLPFLELHTEIEKELEQNPALEIIDVLFCNVCGKELKKGICTSCGSQSNAILQKEELKMLEILSQNTPKDFIHNNPEENQIMPLAAETNFTEYLSTNFNLLTNDEKIKQAGEILIGNLNENGYLIEDLQKICERTGIAINILEEALKLLQQLDPPGLGAHNPQECLLLQIQDLKEEMEISPLIEKIIKNYFTELGAKKFPEIAKDLKVQTKDIEKAAKFIHDNLNPYPAKAFHLYWENQKSQPQILKSPDIIVREENGGFKIEITKEKIPLRISPTYLKIYEEIQNNIKDYTEKEKEHLQRYLTRSKVFLKSIHSRYETIQKIAEFVVERQKEYLQTRDKIKLIPLTQAQISQELSMSESTISRATSNKIVQLPWKELTYFSFFFEFSLSFKAMLKEILINESSKKTLSDKEISELFARKGIKLARRTIAKYREEMNLPSSNRRKRIKKTKLLR